MKGTDIAELLKVCRERKGWSQEKLALKIHVDQAIISKVENGKMQPSYTLVKEWARATDSTDLIGMDFAGEDGVRKLRQMETIFKQVKSMLEPVSFFRFRVERRKGRATTNPR